MNIDTAIYSIEYHSNTQLWSFNCEGKPLCWFKTKKETQDYAIKVMEMKQQK